MECYIKGWGVYRRIALLAALGLDVGRLQEVVGEHLHGARDHNSGVIARLHMLSGISHACYGSCLVDQFFMNVPTGTWVTMVACRRNQVIMLSAAQVSDTC